MSKFTRDEKTCFLAAKDILQIKEDMNNGDYELAWAVITGEFYMQYNNMTEDQLDSEFEERWDEIKDSVEILAFAHVLNNEPIDLLKS